MILQEVRVAKESVASTLLQGKHLKATKSNNYPSIAAFTYSVVLLVVERRYSIWKINYRLKTASQRKCKLKKIIILIWILLKLLSIWDIIISFIGPQPAALQLTEQTQTTKYFLPLVYENTCTEFVQFQICIFIISQLFCMWLACCLFHTCTEKHFPSAPAVWWDSTDHWQSTNTDKTISISQNIPSFKKFYIVWL